MAGGCYHSPAMPSRTALALTLAAALLLPSCRPENPPPPAETIASAASAPQPPASGHDKAYWRAIVDKDYAVPPGAVPADLVIELARYTGSPDPELRDDFGYMIPATWIERDQRLSPQILRELLTHWKGNLRTGLGETGTGTDTVLLRSFSALHLATLVRVDNEHPYLTVADIQSLLDEALAYLAAEKDLRGFEPGKGWIHATAHTADLLAALAASPHLRKTDPKRILDALTARLSTAPDAYTWGEEERLAAVVRALIERKDFDAALLSSWLAAFKADSEKLWESGSQVDPTRYARVQNEKHLLRALYVSLDRTEEPTEVTREAKKQVGDTLGAM